MKAITSHDLAHGSYTNYQTHNDTHSIKSLWNQFIDYADKQQSKRLLWAAIGILGHGTIFTILTFGTVLLLGNNITLLAITCFAMTMVVVVNLAALPTKYTVPIFFLSLFIDLGVIISAFTLHQW